MSKKNSENKTSKKGKAKKIIGWVVTVLLLLVVVLCVLVLSQPKNKVGGIKLFGYSTYVVASPSMENTLMVNDIILIKEVKKTSSLKKGDIITFIGTDDSQFAGKAVTHRIYSEGIEDGKFMSKGDNNPVYDTKLPQAGGGDLWTPQENILGKYVCTLHVFTFLYKIFTSKFGFVFIIIIPLLALLVLQVVRFVMACKMKDDDKAEGDKQVKDVSDVKAIEDEIARKAVEEFIRSQGGANGGTDGKKDAKEDKKDNE